MDQQYLTSIGLTDTQARAYAWLIEKGPHSPPELARALKESRTNTYNVLERLEDLGLAKKHQESKKFIFQAEPPTALEGLVTKKREEALKQEQQLHALMPDMLTNYFSGNEKPGIRFYQGSDGIKQVFDDMIETNQDIYFIRSPYDVEFYDQKFYREFKARRVKAGIKTYALTPDIPSVNHDPAVDAANLFIRTWIPAEDYTSSVEWNAYGNKLAIISYGQEAIAMIIESPQIAASFRQLSALLRLGNSLDS